MHRTVIDNPNRFDVVVIGATPAGIAAAIAAARQGRRVALAEYHHHVGGMSASGLGKSDVENPQVIGGLFREFAERVLADYLSRYGPESEQVRQCRRGLYFEPSVAERVFGEMLREQPAIELLLGHALISADVRHARSRVAVISNRRNGQQRQLNAAVLIDATYEGDLVAAAGAEYRLGREGRREFDEPHAGLIYLDHETHEFLPGCTGAADDRLPAYTYRLCLTDDPENAVPLREPPEGYDRNDFVGYLDDLLAGRLSGPAESSDGRGYYPEHFDTVLRAFSFAEIPNRKFDVNINPRPLSFPFAEENRGYIEGTWRQREAICRRHQQLTLGLLYFVQNDPDVPAEQRALACKYHLPADEFTDNGHFPWQFYVREARRLCGVYTLTEHDVTGTAASRRPGIHFDSVAVGEFPIDSFPTRKREPGRDRVLEGYLSMLDHITRPYQIPYRIMVPEQVDGLLVPVAASTTHVAFSTIRMEPCWMALGQAAGLASHLAIEYGVPPRAVPIDRLQHLLLDSGQIITPYDDPQPESPHHVAVQYFGAKGFFPDYHCRQQEPISRDQAWHWRHLVEQLGAHVPEQWFNVHAHTLPRGELCSWFYQRLRASAAVAPPHLRRRNTDTTGRPA